MSDNNLNDKLQERINLLRKDKNYSEIIKIADKILKDDPTSNFALFNKAFSLGAMEQSEEAILYYEKLIEHHNTSIDPSGALFNMGMLHGDLGEFKKAEFCFGKIIEIHKDDADAWEMRGKAFKYLNEEILSEACLQHADILKNNSIKTPYGEIKNETEAKNEFLNELVRTEDIRIKQALERLHSRLDESDKENAYKWTAYYRGLVDGGSEA